MSYNYKHVSFDLDGVLLHSLHLMESAWNYADRQSGLSIAFPNFFSLIGRPFDEVLSELGVKRSKWAQVREDFEFYSSENVSLLSLFPDTKETLIKMRQEFNAISIVTSKSKRRTKQILEQFEIGMYFDLVVTPEDIYPRKGKPSPDALLYACEQVGVLPKQTIYIGDMEVDYLCACAAGTDFMFASWGYGKIEQQSYVYLNSIKEISDVVES